MSAYVIVDITVTDPVRYEQYKKLSGAAVTTCAGRFLVRGGKVDVLEGTWHPSRFVILEFPTVEGAKEWWTSETYRPAKEIRQATATTNMIVVEGV